MRRSKIIGLSEASQKFWTHQEAVTGLTNYVWEKDGFLDKKAHAFSPQAWDFSLARQGGFEPPAGCLEGRCSRVPLVYIGVEFP